MAASIRSLRNGITPVDDASRDDLVVGDVVNVSALVPATTYTWVLSFIPDGSTAVFSGIATAVSPGNFTVDLPGSYLVRLTTDIGLLTESTQYVRLRFLTPDLGLRLVAAGERPALPAAQQVRACRAAPRPHASPTKQRRAGCTQPCA